MWAAANLRSCGHEYGLKQNMLTSTHNFGKALESLKNKIIPLSVATWKAAIKRTLNSFDL